MMRLSSFSALLAGFLLVSATSALADDSDQFFPADRNRVVLGVSQYNFTDSNSDQSYPSYRVELRLSEVPVWKLHPWLGFEYAHNEITDVGVTTDVDTYWIGAGLETDIDLYSDWLVLTLQTGVGYFDGGNELPAGWQYNPKSGLEFRHQAELGVRFGEGWRASLGISHMSNGDLEDNNNSINSVGLNLHVPMAMDFGGSEYGAGN
ncbi:MAG TPA: acyloxyacyl hydrolase [Alphaproteobacteria bacterium]